MLAAFQVRSLLERSKVNDRACNASMSVLRFKKISDRPFTVTGSGWPHELFNMSQPEPTVISALDVCNQLIHYYWMETWSEAQTFDSMLIFSDYKRHKWAYEFRISKLLQLFSVFANDSSAVEEIELKWDDKKKDYIVTKAK